MFDEVDAAIFITQLREAGLYVKLVGLTSQPTPGGNGLAFVPDIALDKALTLVDRTVCLIIPHNSCGIARLNNDPRVQELFNQLPEQAYFIIGEAVERDLCAFLPCSALKNVETYSVDKNIVKFAHNLAKKLLAV